MPARIEPDDFIDLALNPTISSILRDEPARIEPDDFIDLAAAILRDDCGLNDDPISVIFQFLFPPCIGCAKLIVPYSYMITCPKCGDEPCLCALLFSFKKCSCPIFRKWFNPAKDTRFWGDK